MHGPLGTLWLLRSGEPAAHTYLMNTEVRNRHEEWQAAVRKHHEMVRNARNEGLSHVQVQNLGKTLLLAVDVSFARLKGAEADQGPGPARLPSEPISRTRPDTL
jgi:hypothetical protein